MKTTVLKEIISFILGREYYANIVNVRGTNECEICCFIFLSKEEAQRHREELNATMSYTFVETISFRSRKTYNSTVKS